MSADLILKASSIITVDDANPRAEAVAIDSSTGTIVAVGSLADVQAAASGATVTDLGDSVLLPGFIDSHNHPLLGGSLTQPPGYWIAPYVGYPTFADVEALWHKANAEEPAGKALVFTGLDRMLQQAPPPTAESLDAIFGERPVFVLDNSGHEGYFNTAAMALAGWKDATPPADPVGGRFGRNSDGTSTGQAFETAALLAVGLPAFKAAGLDPLIGTAQWYRFMSKFGITSTSEHSFSSKQAGLYDTLATMKAGPVLRITAYQMTIDPELGKPLAATAPKELFDMPGFKLWADGSPWVGTIAASFPYLDTPVVKTAEIPLGPQGEKMMNYTRVALDAELDKLAAIGGQVSFHVNGDVGIDVVLDAYERALVEHDLLGTDHRWRIEHCGAGRGDQFKRAADLGVHVSLGPFQFIYWGDLLDGQMFAPEIGSEWMRWGDCIRGGAVTSFHNDGPVSPPNPLLNIQSAITRATPSGQVHGPNQIISLDDALKAETIWPAKTLFRDDIVGSIQVGKKADFVELSKDPYLADPEKIVGQVKVLGTWLNGAKTDPDALVAEAQALQSQDEHHEALAHAASSHRC